MKKKKSLHIDENIKNGWLVAFNRKPLDKHLLYGFVVDFNEDFTLVHIFDRDLFILDGYCVFPNKDVKSHAVYNDSDDFLNDVIRAKKIIPKSLPQITIDGWEEIVRSVSDSFPFFVVETERLHKDECYVGKLEEIKKNSFLLNEIDTDAYWMSTTKYKFSDLTMIKFGGEYETTLAIVNELREKNPD